MLSNSFVQQFPLLSTLTKEEIQYLASKVEYFECKRYSYVYVCGEPSEHIYLLREGSVKISNYGDEFRDVLKDILFSPAIFGELCLSGELKRKDTAMAGSDGANYFRIRLSDFVYLLSKNSQLCLHVIKLISEKLVEAENRVEGFKIKDARERIIDFLRSVISKEGKKIGFDVVLKHSMTQQDIAYITGTSRQTVTAVLKDLKKNGVIHFTRKSILVRNLAFL